MYNSTTEDIIRQIPNIGDIDIERLPQELTKIFAKIVTLRASLNNDRDPFSKKFKPNITLLRTLANNLETLTVLHQNHEYHNSIAFVAGTAHYLLLMMRRANDSQLFSSEFSSQSIPTAASAIALFLIGNSPADAAEVAGKVNLSQDEQNISASILKGICLLAQGNLQNIVGINIPEKDYNSNQADQEAEDYLWELILRGIKYLAANLLDPTIKESHDYFKDVIDLAILNTGDNNLQSIYAGPFHLAKLLSILQSNLLSRGVIYVPPPEGADKIEWQNFLIGIAKERPYLWENHFDAVQTGFLNYGTSAILTFPTGAGKTNLSELKIAATLMLGKSVIYLVPTHALEDQVTKGLNKIFNSIIHDLEMELGSEYTEFMLENNWPSITVMTPERCLAKLSLDPDGFQQVGLVVFDEFHLIHGTDDRMERRSLNAMFCLLRLFTEIPTADYLLISAMVENSSEIADWVASITERPCINFNSNWKPTRQLHGCVVYEQGQITELQRKLRANYLTGKTNAPSKKIKDQLLTSAYNIFSLKNIWNSDDPKDYFIKKLLTEDVCLGANKYWNLTSNRNEIAADLATFFAKKGIKTLVFVDNPLITQSTAKKIIEKLKFPNNDRAELIKHNEQLLDGLDQELGGLEYSYFVKNAEVAVHHGLMLPLERRLNEQFFKDKNGVNVVTATATLAQGINMPAEIVIIAGDDRFDEETDARKTIAAHEILNAAGRAGRAGSAAQGVVLLIPGDIITFKGDSLDSAKWAQLKNEVFSKSDQCLIIDDPLTFFLDTISDSTISLTPDQQNLLFRLNLDKESASSVDAIFNKSLAAFRAKKKEDKTFSQQLAKLIDKKENLAIDILYEEWVSVVSLKTGIEPKIISELGDAIDKTGVENIYTYSLNELIEWMMNWLSNSADRIGGLFSTWGAQIQLARALNLNREKFTIKEIATNFLQITPLIFLYISGENYKIINEQIPGKSDEFISKARHFILKLIPHISVAFSTLSICIREKCIEEGRNPEEIPSLIKSMATHIREGFDTEDKLLFKTRHPRYTRVQCHKLTD